MAGQWRILGDSFKAHKNVFKVHNMSNMSVQKTPCQCVNITGIMWMPHFIQIVFCLFQDVFSFGILLCLFSTRIIPPSGGTMLVKPQDSGYPG